MHATFKTSNAAFDGHPGHEAARILRTIADHLEQEETSGIIFDINGNQVGTWNLDENIDLDTAVDVAIGTLREFEHNNKAVRNAKNFAELHDHMDANLLLIPFAGHVNVNLLSNAISRRLSHTNVFGD